MFTEIPDEVRYGQNSTVLRSYDHMLRLLSHIVKTAPPPGLGIPVPPMALILTDPANTARYVLLSSGSEALRIITRYREQWPRCLFRPKGQRTAEGRLERMGSISWSRSLVILVSVLDAAIARVLTLMSIRRAPIRFHLSRAALMVGLGTLRLSN